NPSFSVVSALLSRCRVHVLEPLDHQSLLTLLQRGVDDLNARRSAAQLEPAPAALAALAQLADGDARRALGLLEAAAEAALEGQTGTVPLTKDDVAQAAQRHYVYDRQGEAHYNLISALHKTI